MFFKGKLPSLGGNDADEEEEEQEQDQGEL